MAFLNAYKFQDQARRVLRHSQPELIVLEASSIVEIDFTAAQVILEFIEHCKQLNITFAIARLELTRAQEAFDRFGLTDAVRHDHFFHSVAEAIEILAKNPKKSNEFHEEPV